jgi:acyl carrier protein
LKLVEDRADELRDTLIEPDRTADRTRALAYMHRIAKARFPLIAQLDLDEFARSALSECGVDSLGVMELVIAIQGETGRMLPDSLLMSQNVDSPINWVEALYPTGENVEDIENGQESVIWR